MRKAKSPMRLVMNALRPAQAFCRVRVPEADQQVAAHATPSQPTKSSTRLSASTSVSIIATKRLRYAK